MTQSMKSMALLSLFILATVLLFVGAPDSLVTRSFRLLWNLGHVGYYFLGCLLLSRLPPIAALNPVLRVVFLLLLTLGSGIIVEYLQYGTRRESDWLDVWRDLIGCLLFLVYDRSLWQGIRRVYHRLASALVILLLLIQLQPLLLSVIDGVIARVQFPLLAGFESPYELDRFVSNAHLQVVVDESNKDNHVLSVYFGTERYSNLHLLHFPSDFRGYRRLSLWLFNPNSQPMTIFLRIHDQAHESGKYRFLSFDRYSRGYMIKPGANRLEVDLQRVRNSPKHRQMDMSRISDITLFVSRLELPRQILIDDIRLQ